MYGYPPPWGMPPQYPPNQPVAFIPVPQNKNEFKEGMKAYKTMFKMWNEEEKKQQEEKKKKDSGKPTGRTFSFLEVMALLFLFGPVIGLMQYSAYKAIIGMLH